MNKMGSELASKVDDCDTPECKKGVVKDRIYENAEYENDVKVNDDDSVVDILADGLVDNYEEHGVFGCPCREIDDETEMDDVCPCDYYKEEIEERGYCLCMMYFKDKESDNE